MAQYSRMLTNALLNPSFGGQGMFNLGSQIAQNLPGGQIAQADIMSRRKNEGQKSMLVQAGQATAENMPEVYQSILATAQQTGADPTQAATVLRQRVQSQVKQQEAARARAKEQGVAALTSMAYSPEFDFNKKEHRAAYMSLASKAGVSSSEAMEIVTQQFDKYKTVGNRVFDTTTGEYVSPPEEPKTIETMKPKDIAGLYEDYTPESVLQFIKDPANTPLVPKANEEKVTADDKAQKKLFADLAQTDNVLGAISQARTLAKDQWALFYSVGELPLPTDARRLNNVITKIRANLGFDQLEEMRLNSPTGGALGQVSNLENRLLQSVIDNLDPSAGDEAFNKQLDQVEYHYNNFKRSLLGLAPEGPEYRTTPDDRVLYRDPESGSTYEIGRVTQ